MNKYFIIILSLIFLFSSVSGGFAKVPENISAISMTNLSSSTAKIGECFQAKIPKNLTLKSGTTIPSDSIIYGQVIKVKKSKRFSRGGSITLTANQIQTPQGQTIPLENFKSIVVSPYVKPLKERFLERIPIAVASSGTSIPLSAATNLNGGIVYAISLGAGVVMGAVSGIFDPDYEKTRTQTAAIRAFESTPIGGIKIAASKGKEVNLKIGDCIIFKYNNKK
ncbi:MAG: hypothetical protein V2B14_06425 [bacterium]